MLVGYKKRTGAGVGRPALVTSLPTAMVGKRPITSARSRLSHVVMLARRLIWATRNQHPPWNCGGVLLSPGLEQVGRAVNAAGKIALVDSAARLRSVILRDVAWTVCANIRSVISESVADCFSKYRDSHIGPGLSILGNPWRV
jgi:hypothetical protein